MICQVLSAPKSELRSKTSSPKPNSLIEGCVLFNINESGENMAVTQVPADGQTGRPNEACPGAGARPALGRRDVPTRAAAWARRPVHRADAVPKGRTPHQVLRVLGVTGTDSRRRLLGGGGAEGGVLGTERPCHTTRELQSQGWGRCSGSRRAESPRVHAYCLRVSCCAHSPRRNKQREKRGAPRAPGILCRPCHSNGGHGEERYTQLRHLDDRFQGRGSEQVC